MRKYEKVDLEVKANKRNRVTVRTSFKNHCIVRKNQ